MSGYGVAGAMLTLPTGELVLQRRDEFAPRSPNQLAYFGGHIEAGETGRQAVYREVGGEETSLDLSSLDVISMGIIMVPPESHPLRTDLTLHLFHIAISSLDFEVYEGTGAEAYSIAELQQRIDVSYLVRYSLAHLGFESYLPMAG